MTPIDLQLELTAPGQLGLDEPLVTVARLSNRGARPLTTSSRLNLVEGDLWVVVSGPGQQPHRSTWPYPVDSGLRQVILDPGEFIEGGVLLLVGPGREAMFPVPGVYSIAAEFSPTPTEVVRSDPLTVLRQEPADPDRRATARLLVDPEVATGLVAAPIVERFPGAPEATAEASPTIRLLAALAGEDLDEVQGAAAAVADRAGPVTAAATAVSVMPAGLIPGDERLSAVGAALAGRADDHGRVTALLSEQPWRP